MKEFFSPEQAKFLYSKSVEVYQKAFAGEPWFEVSKCADSAIPAGCVGGLSSIKIGETCEKCGNCPTKPAYEKEELIERFESLANTRPTAWYIEENELGITLAGVAWTNTPLEIAQEKYSDNPKMTEWMTSIMGSEKVIWLDEVFADKSIKPSGNLSNFRLMCKGFSEKLTCETIAFRTINERMINATKRSFPFYNVQVFQKELEVPDRRDFVVINVEKPFPTSSYGCFR